MTDIKSMFPAELEVFVKELGEPKFRAKQLYEWIHRRHAASFDEMTNLPKQLREKLSENASLCVLQPVTVQVSRLDGTRKYLFRLPDGNCIESVFMRYHHGNSVCISSQVGCRMGCKFCASALGGFVRNLTAGEMLSQVLTAEAATGETINHIVVMGMGVAGAGVATLLSQAFATLLCWLYIRGKMRLLIPTGEERRYDNKRVSILLNNGVPMGLQFSITGIGIIMLQSANNALGTVCVASFTAAMRIKYLFTCVFENIGVAMATYCGQNIGARKLDRIRRGVKDAIAIMLVYFVFTVIIIYPFADEMMMLFVKSGEQEVIDNAAMFMRIANYFYPALGLLTIFRYSIQGLGYSNLSMMSGVMEMIARCGVSLWLVPALAFKGVCLGDPVAWVFADLFLLPAFLWLYHHIKKTKATD